jgi:hypothetical protein
MKIKFISNFDPEEISGGISGMNAAAWNPLSEIADATVAPLDKPEDYLKSRESAHAFVALILN